MSLSQSPTIIPDDWEALSITFYVPNPDVVPDEVQLSQLAVLITRSDGSRKSKILSFLERLTDDSEGQNTHLPA